MEKDNKIQMEWVEYDYDMLIRMELFKWDERKKRNEKKCKRNKNLKM